MERVRLWSLDPQYLDAKGLVALWRESLLAKKVLEGKTKGYKNHPQLIRFKLSEDPLAAINNYLRIIYDESCRRGYHFDKNKFNSKATAKTIAVTSSQLEYEFAHLKKKLHVRDPIKLQEITSVKKIQAHSLFTIIHGEVEAWEK